LKIKKKVLNLQSIILVKKNMNASKRLTFLTIGIILAIPIITGCFRVGEDDPFLSFITRKNRVVAEWKINSDVKTVRQNKGPAYPIEDVVVKTKKKNWSMKITIVNTDSVINYIGTVDYDVNYIKFDKSGNFTRIYNYQYVIEIALGEDGDAVRERHVCEEAIKGTWNFLGGVEDDYKNKERLVLNWESRDFKETVDTMSILADPPEGYTPIYVRKRIARELQSYKNGEKSEIYVLKRLANKEIQMYQNISTREDITETYPQDIKISATIEGKREITLKR
jgi:hypothetical protein